MSRRGMPKKGKQVPMPAHEKGSNTGVVPGGEQESTIGDNDVPIVLTRTDPNFDERERLAEELWNKEKGELEGTGEEEEHTEPEVKTDDTDKSDDTDADTEAKEEAEEVEEEDKTVEGDGKKEEDRAEEIEEEYETLTIDGQKVQKPKNEIYEAGKRALQKDLSADKRLEDATRLLRETQATISARLPDGVAHQRPLQPVPDKEQQAKIKQLYEKLRYGDDDEGEAAMTELLQGRTATPQIEEILYGVSRYIERERIRSVFTTPQDKGGYADIYPEEGGGKCTDPEIWEFFDYKVNQMINRGEPNELPTYQKAADEVRKRFSAFSSKPSLSDKRDKKRDIDVVKGVKAKSHASEKPREETHKDIINEHLKFRGLMSR